MPWSWPTTALVIDVHTVCPFEWRKRRESAYTATSPAIIRASRCCAAGLSSGTVKSRMLLDSSSAHARPKRAPKAELDLRILPASSGSRPISAIPMGA
ncbi:hypothetical protein AHiyo4_11970 [Arthrobacter sp. Hiyo4]|nr:hypothetical protein AHiyo4_11970 [Arthrobacter sp. Hiyo4]